MSIVIRKRINLEFLGEDYKDSYLVFKSIPLKDYDGITKELTDIGEDGSKAIGFMLKVMGEYFLDGKFEASEVTKDDLGDLDQQTAITIFEELTGSMNPKAEASSQTLSQTEAPAEK